MLRAWWASLAHWIDRLKTMGEQPSKLACFLAELRRRHVFRVAVGYAAVAFVVLQLSEIVLPAFSAEWALQLVVVFVVLGFPVVMVLAWVFDITTDGIRVTAALEHDVADSPSTGTLPRLALMTVTLFSVIGVGSWWVLNTIPGTEGVTTALRPSVIPVTYDPTARIRSLAVLPLMNFSGESRPRLLRGGHARGADRAPEPASRDFGLSPGRPLGGTRTRTRPSPKSPKSWASRESWRARCFVAGDEVRISVQLIHGPSDTHVWATSYERNFTDVLALQSEVADAIAEELKRELSMDGDTPMLSFAPLSEVPKANDAFMRARFEQFDETPGGLLAALDHYREAVEADPMFAGAYVGLASTELMLGLAEPSDPTESLARARVMALKAFEIDQELPEVHDILALIDEQLSAELFGQPAGIDTAEPMSEVRIVHRSPTGSADVGVGGGRPRHPHRHLGGSEPRCEIRRIQARLHPDLRELYAGGPATPGRVGRLGDPERADGLGGVGPPGLGGPAAQRGRADRRGLGGPQRGLCALTGARGGVGGPRATLLLAG